MVCSMRLRAMLAGLLLSIGLTHASPAVTRIENDMGGSLGEYLLRFAAIRDSGQRVMIDGNCYSSCTIVTAMIPRDRICITERAVLGFHASWVDDDKGRRVTSATGTQVLFEMYPRGIRSWIMRNGGLGANTILLKGSELAAFYSFCK
jgi:hypothetical protein